jgi:hypothetical protein
MRDVRVTVEHALVLTWSALRSIRVGLRQVNAAPVQACRFDHTDWNESNTESGG